MPSPPRVVDPSMPSASMVEAFNAIRKVHGIEELRVNPMLHTRALEDAAGGRVTSETVKSNMGDLVQTFRDMKKHRSVNDALRVAHSRVEAGTSLRSTEIVMAAMHKAESDPALRDGASKRRFVVSHVRGLEGPGAGSEETKAGGDTTEPGEREFSDGMELGEHLVSGAVNLIDEGVIEFILSALSSAVGVDLSDEVKDIVTKTTKVSTNACVRCCFPKRDPAKTHGTRNTTR